MNWQVWTEIESLLLRYGVRPILAVVPDIKDPSLVVTPPVDDFWERVRGWQSRGWAIALHGYQHVYVNSNRGILGLTPRSEFAGLSCQVQEEKLRRGLDIFACEGVLADCWVAPSHSFDWTTVGLLVDIGVHVISDGLWKWPHTDDRGVTWVPQQLWRDLHPMPPGVWTVCIHFNNWGEHELGHFRLSLDQFAPAIIGLEQAVDIGRERHLTMADRYHAWRELIWTNRVKPAISRLVKGDGF